MFFLFFLLPVVNYIYIYIYIYIYRHTHTLHSRKQTAPRQEIFILLGVFFFEKWFPEKCFSFILDGKHFLEVVKNLEMSYYLLIISNLILKLLIAIYILF